MTKHFLTLALLLLAHVAAASPASNLPAVPAATATPTTSVNAADSAPQTPVTDPTAITPEKLGEILADLGYEAKDLSTHGKKDYYRIELERNGWKLFISVSLSPDRSILWLGVKFKRLEDAAAASPSAWLKLLELTAKYHPIHFAIDNDSRIRVWLAIPNTGIDAATLRYEIENLDDTVRTVASFLNSANFSGK